MKHKTGDMYITAGQDIDNKYSVLLQKVDGVPCIALHKCHERGGLHYTSGDDKSLFLAIPLKSIVKLAIERRLI